MSNEVLYLLLTFTTLLGALGAYKLGKTWLIGYMLICAFFAWFTVSKVVNIFGFPITCSAPLYTVLFLITDMLNERYGPQTGRRAVLMSLTGLVVLAVFAKLITMMAPAANAESASQAFNTILDTSMRVTVAGWISYLVFQNFDVWLFNKLRTITNGTHLWLRNNISTFTSATLDSYFFFFVAFYGTYDNWYAIATTVLVVKLIFAALDTTVIYASKLITPNDHSSRDQHVPQTATG